MSTFNAFFLMTHYGVGGPAGRPVLCAKNAWAETPELVGERHNAAPSHPANYVNLHGRSSVKKTSRESNEMYIFSVNATARNDRHGVPEGSQVPFMVYVSFLDRFGAEQLCKLYLLRAGFKDVQIEQCKALSAQALKDKHLLRADPSIKEALESGYKIRMFEGIEGVH